MPATAAITTTGSERADALLRAKHRANAAFYAGVPEAPPQRQFLRREARKAAKRAATQARLTAIKNRRKARASLAKQEA